MKSENNKRFIEKHRRQLRFYQMSLKVLNKNYSKIIFTAFGENSEF